MTNSSQLPQNPGQGLFGLPTTKQTSKVVILPVPWEVTTSYGSGTSQAPASILKASAQLDLYDPELKNNFQKGFHIENPPSWIEQLNTRMKPVAQGVISELEKQQFFTPEIQDKAKQVNAASQQVNLWVKDQSQELLRHKHLPAVLGGDHSSPFGLIEALSETHTHYSVLQIDAHHDLRPAYEGFEHSHASIMHNVMQLKTPPQKLVQVGIRDFCEQEFQDAQEHPAITCFSNKDLKRQLFQGTPWTSLCEQILGELTDLVYISFDIDGLSPENCPSTGTPVPGGLSFDQAMHLIERLGKSSKSIIGFDLCEVVPHSENELEANIGARVLLNLCSWSVYEG